MSTYAACGCIIAFCSVGLYLADARTLTRTKNDTSRLRLLRTQIELRRVNASTEHFFPHEYSDQELLAELDVSVRDIINRYESYQQRTPVLRMFTGGRIPAGCEEQVATVLWNLDMLSTSDVYTRFNLHY